jgi:glyoxylase-like metal-dependent hydrolase (beta-lactamase superfamily II)
MAEPLSRLCSWRGFTAACELDEIAPGIVLISLPGHTRGHAAVAVDVGHRWILYAGDAFYRRGTLDGRSAVPRILRAQESLVGRGADRIGVVVGELHALTGQRVDVRGSCVPP